MEYFTTSPFGEEREDVRTGYAFAALANIVYGSLGGKHTFKPEDFIAKFRGQDEPTTDTVTEKLSPEEIWRRAKVMALTLGRKMKSQ